MPLINANISYFSSIYISAFESGYSSFCPHLKQRIDWQLIAAELRENAGENKDIFSNYQDLRTPGLDIPPDLVEGVSTVSSVDYGNVGNVAN